MWLWRRIGDAIQAEVLLSWGLATVCAGIAAWLLDVLAHMPPWIAVTFALGIFLIALAILLTILPPFFGWLARLSHGDPPSPPSYHYENIQSLVQVSGSGNTVIVQSDRVVVTPEGEGPLLPPGSIIGRSWTESVRMEDAWKVEVLGPMMVEPLLPPVSPPASPRSRRRSRRDPPRQPPSQESGDKG
jgi:hypothetical protein